EENVTRLLAASDEVAGLERRSAGERHVDLVAIRSLEFPVQRILFVVVAVAVADLDRHLQVAVVFDGTQARLERGAGDGRSEPARLAVSPVLRSWSPPC